jgi:hypothetical protein
MPRNFEIRPFENKTLSWWYNRRNRIDMNPSYQRRGGLWSQADKAYLIDSILNGYDIPKIYVADFTWGTSPLNKSKLPYAIIDGKQRFEAIFDFFEGRLVLNDDFVYLDDPSIILAGLGFKDLQKNYTEIADDFQNHNLMVMGVYAQNEEPINELFVRLNRSKALTGAEIRNAMSGPAPGIIRQIAKHEFFTVNVVFETKRAQDLNAAAKMLSFEYYTDFRDTKKTDLDIFVQTVGQRSHESLELSGRRVIENLDSMNAIFLPGDSLLGSAGIVPVYYWLVRKMDEQHLSRFREFINAFEKARRHNRALIRDNPQNQSIKPMLVEYDNYNRSTNNAQSHRQRFRILDECFNSYLKTGSF